MHKLNQKGELLIPLVIVVVLLFGSLAFGAWAFFERQDYKNNSDAKSATAVKLAEEKLSVKKDAEFAESYKNPYTSYKSAADLGTLVLNYPKTWSNYVIERPGNLRLDGYMHPSFVPENKEDTNYALRYQVLQSAYSQEIKQFDSKIKTGRTSSTPFRAPKVPSTLGVRFEGELDTTKKSGVMIVLPVRDKTIRIWTEGTDFRGDLDRILNELTFVE